MEEGSILKVLEVQNIAQRKELRSVRQVNMKLQHAKF